MREPSWEELIGSPAPPFRDESLAPQIDERLLRALVRRQLSEETARAVYRLIHSFKSWMDAHSRVLIEEFQRGPDAAAGEPPSPNV